MIKLIHPSTEILVDNERMRILINLVGTFTLAIFDLGSVECLEIGILWCSVRAVGSGALLEHLASTFEAQILRNKGRMKTGES